MRVTEVSLPESLLIALIGILVVVSALALLAVCIVIISKCVSLFGKSKASDSPAPTPAASPAVSGAVSGAVALPDNTSAGEIKLNNVDEKTAALVMAVVSDELGIPLNRLQFKSIKCVD